MIGSLKSMEQIVKCEPAAEAEILKEDPPQRHFAYLKSHII
jgi:hypothetical protein